jgi:isoleucyl-tRNA synthetase
LLFDTRTIKHELPHCWRTDQILYYKLVPTINLNIQKIKADLLQNFEKITFSTNVGKERMRDTIKTAPDWCLSRSRIWGTPIPMWINTEDDTDVLICESANHLSNLLGYEVTDLHTDKMPDTLQHNNKTYRNVGFTFDCWYESGSQFYAQHGKYVVADFILEGLDQTRGWFYTLLVLSTALVNDTPYKNLLINGLVMDKNGVKFSKRLKNYEHIDIIIDEYGIDAVRLYLVSSPASKGLSFRFDKTHIAKWIQLVNIPLKNILALTLDYAKLYELKHNKKLEYVVSDNDIDIWMMMKFQTFVYNIVNHVQSYNLCKLGSYIHKFVQNLSGYYCKFGRNNIKGKYPETWHKTLNTLGNIMVGFSIVCSNIIPETSTLIFNTLTDFDFGFGPKQHQTTQLCDYDFHDLKLIKQNNENTEICEVITIVFEQIHTVLTFRAQEKKSIKYPFNKVLFGLQSNQLKYIDKLKQFTDLIQQEANIFNIEYADLDKYTEKHSKAINKNIGIYFKKNQGKVIKYIETYNSQIAQDIFTTGKHTAITPPEDVPNFVLTDKYIELINYFTPIDDLKTFTNDDGITIYVDMTQSKDVYETYISRQIATTVQQYRKQINIKMTDKVDIRYTASSEQLIELIETKKELITHIINRDFTLLNESNTEYLSDLFAQPTKIKLDGCDGDVTIYLQKLS